MLATALAHDGPVAFRYPRGAATGVPLDEEFRVLPIGKGTLVEDGDDIVILAIGRSVVDALEASRMLKENGISAAVMNCRFVKPLDIELISSLVARIPRVITVEENALQGGFGSAVLEALNDAGIRGLHIKRIGVADTFVEHGPQQLLRSLYGIDADAIVKTAVKMMGEEDRGQTTDDR
jgi:1-deoxy-D-xylulose-5-phosphate synthase